MISMDLPTLNRKWKSTARVGLLSAVLAGCVLHAQQMPAPAQQEEILRLQSALAAQQKQLATLQQSMERQQKQLELALQALNARQNAPSRPGNRCKHRSGYSDSTPAGSGDACHPDARRRL